MNTALVIYDLTGKVWAIYYGEQETPQGLLSLYVDIPDGATVERVDLSDPYHPRAVLSQPMETDLTRLEKKMDVLQEAILNLTNQVAIAITPPVIENEDKEEEVVEG